MLTGWSRAVTVILMETTHDSGEQLTLDLDAKVPAVSIRIGFSESNYIQEGATFVGPTAWRDASAYLVCSPAPDLGSYKTDFVVTFADGETYSGRFDIGADAPSLEEHVRDFLASDLPSCEAFRNSYKIGD